MTSPSLQMDDAVYERLNRLCEAGNKAVGEGRFDAAVTCFNDAWEWVPEPKKDWEASTWILTAIGDCYFRLRDLKSARPVLEYALRCPGGPGNPFIHLRLGQVLLDAGEPDAAADELMRAYMGGGAERFAEDDPKYLAFLATRAQL
ncbi:tetratricopeptide repeat protein [Lysobacter capsici]|uniref:tetratricopeptide repeat protein n=1 Tax=Lysobacter capsici TaxID=435897 RepID=UPI001C005CD5|nr:tetratricopeptide repeat protein [Lysobacter capsici]QWF17929.1 tetratricopeptide repeat protein [Lysobacter capsici]